MGTLLVTHHPYDHVLPGKPVQYGGKFVFTVNNNPVSLTRAVLEAIEVEHRSSVEFFPSKLLGGLTLDYVLIPQQARLTEAQVAQVRPALIATIQRILEAHKRLMNFQQIEVRHASAH